MDGSKVSVVVPIYNMEKYLGRCVDSILAQSYSNIEVILVNDGSKDSSAEICDRYAEKDSRIKVLHKTNGGLSSARNAGIDVASGDYIGFVDSDDFVSPDMYKLLVERLENSGCEIANVMYVRADEEGNTTPSKVPHNTDKEISALQFTRELMLHTGDVSVCTKLFRAEIFNDLRFPEGKLNEDLLFMLDVFCKVNKVAYVAHIGYYYFIRGGSTSSGYGKALIDMVDNSLTAKKIVDSAYPSLRKETARFALFQHMAYLLIIPTSEAEKSNVVYQGAKKYLRKQALGGIFNKYLTLKNKIAIILLAIAPKTTAKYHQKKRAKR